MARILLALALALPAVPAVAQVEPVTAAFDSLQLADRRLATVAERLLAGNVALCRQTMWITGLLLHSADQYDPAPALWFANGPLAAAQVLPGSPAERAGVQPNDGLAAIGGVAVAALPSEPDRPLRDAAFDLLAGQDPAAITITLYRQGQRIDVRLTAARGCRALAEVLVGRADLARSDGRVIQIAHARVARLSDEELAVSFAHELAHVVLEHRRRLEAAGNNRRLRRQAEIEADLLSLHLLANAGYDAAIGPVFWRSDAGRRSDAGLFRSGIYASPRRRAEMMEQEIRDHLTGDAVPSAAAHLLAQRDLPFPPDD